MESLSLPEQHYPYQSTLGTGDSAGFVPEVYVSEDRMGTSKVVCEIESGNLTPIPPEDVLLNAIGIYFSHCHNQPYGIFHEGNFRQRLTAGHVPDHVLFAVLCSSFRFLHPKPDRCWEISELYAETSWHLVKARCFSGEGDDDISKIQTLTLLSIFDFTGIFVLLDR